MNNLRIAILATCVLLANGAVAQDAAKKAEDQRRSSEMMKPQTNAPAKTPGASQAAPMSEADRKAAEARRSSEMMKPQTNAPAGASSPSSSPGSQADRKAAEARKKSEMMKPQ